MKKYKPSEPFLVPMYLFAPQIITAKGSSKKVIPENGKLFYCSFRSFGGTEKVIDNVLSVEDTAVIETRYRADIKSDSILKDSNGLVYEIIGTPENISMKNQYLRFKIRAKKGGA